MFKALAEQDLASSSSPTGIDDAIAQLEWENRQRKAHHSPLSGDDSASAVVVEPLTEPPTDEIPWSDLEYWLGSATSGSVDCACPTCQGVADCELCMRDALEGGGGGYYLFIPGSFYSRLSFKIPVIQLPRIEGIN